MRNHTLWWGRRGEKVDETERKSKKIKTEGEFPLEPVNQL